MAAAGALKVVLVDDDDEVRRALRRLIGACGASVTDFASAADALLHVEVRGADVVITDLEMPVMDGAQLAAALRARGLAARVILISGRDEGYCRARLAEVGAAPVEAVAEKPIPLAEMRRLLAPLAPTPAPPVAPAPAAPPRYPAWECVSGASSSRRMRAARAGHP